MRLKREKELIGCSGTTSELWNGMEQLGVSGAEDNNSPNQRAKSEAASQDKRKAIPSNAREAESAAFDWICSFVAEGLSVVELVLLELSGLWAVEQPHSSAQWKQANTSNSTNNSLSLYSFFSLLSNNSNSITLCERKQKSEWSCFVCSFSLYCGLWPMALSAKPLRSKPFNECFSTSAFLVLNCEWRKSKE